MYSSVWNFVSSCVDAGVGRWHKELGGKTATTAPPQPPRGTYNDLQLVQQPVVGQERVQDVQSVGLNGMTSAKRKVGHVGCTNKQGYK